MQHALHYDHVVSVFILFYGKIDAVIVVGSEAVNAATGSFHYAEACVLRCAVEAVFIHFEGEEELQLLHGRNGRYLCRTDFIKGDLLHGISLGEVASNGKQNMHHNLFVRL